MEEIWKDIKGYEGCYQISNLGRVKSLSRPLNRGKGVGMSVEKILSCTIDKKTGYRKCCLMKDNTVKGLMCIDWSLKHLFQMKEINLV